MLKASYPRVPIRHGQKHGPFESQLVGRWLHVTQPATLFARKLTIAGESPLRGFLMGTMPSLNRNRTRIRAWMREHIAPISLHDLETVANFHLPCPKTTVIHHKVVSILRCRTECCCESDPSSVRKRDSSVISSSAARTVRRRVAGLNALGRRGPGDRRVRQRLRKENVENVLKQF